MTRSRRPTKYRNLVTPYEIAGENRATALCTGPEHACRQLGIVLVAERDGRAAVHELPHLARRRLRAVVARGCRASRSGVVTRYPAPECDRMCSTWRGRGVSLMTTTTAPAASAPKPLRTAVAIAAARSRSSAYVTVA